MEIEPLELLGIWMDVYGDGGGRTLNLYWAARIVEENRGRRTTSPSCGGSSPTRSRRDELAFGHLDEVLSAFRNQHA